MELIFEDVEGNKSVLMENLEANVVNLKNQSNLILGTKFTLDSVELISTYTGNIDYFDSIKNISISPGAKLYFGVLEKGKNYQTPPDNFQTA